VKVGTVLMLVAALLLAPAGASAQTTKVVGSEMGAPMPAPPTVALEVAMPGYAGGHVEGTMALIGAMAIPPEMTAAGKVLGYGGFRGEMGGGGGGGPGEERQYSAYIVPLIQGVDASLTVDAIRANTATFRLMLIQPHEKGKELIDAAAKRVVAALVEQPPLPAEELAKRMKDVEAQIDVIEDKMNLIRALAANHKSIGPEILKERVKSAELEKQRLEMELTAQQARRNAIAEQIGRVEKAANELKAQDQVLEQLRRVESLRKEQWERTAQLHKSGQASANDVAQAEEQWMAARINIAEREEGVRQKAAVGLLDRLNAELAAVMINEAEMEVRLDMVRRQQPLLDLRSLDDKKLTRLADQYGSLFRDPGALPPLIDELEKKKDELRRARLALQVTDVKLIGAPPPENRKGD